MPSRKHRKSSGSGRRRLKKTVGAAAARSSLPAQPPASTAPQPPQTNIVQENARPAAGAPEETALRTAAEPETPRAAFDDGQKQTSGRKGAALTASVSAAQPVEAAKVAGAAALRRAAAPTNDEAAPNASPETAAPSAPALELPAPGAPAPQNAPDGIRGTSYSTECQNAAAPAAKAPDPAWDTTPEKTASAQRPAENKAASAPEKMCASPEAAPLENAASSAPACTHAAANPLVGAGDLFAAGGVLAAAGLLLFAAAHWLGWPPAVRLGFFGGLLVLSALPLLVKKKPPAAARRAAPSYDSDRRRLDGASWFYALALGLFLAAAGQTYQSGAGAPAVCAAWFALLAPWVLYIRRPGIFTFAYAVGLAAALLPILENTPRWRAGAVLDGLLPAALLSLAAVLILSPLVRRAPASSTGLRAALLAAALSAVCITQAGIPALAGFDAELTPVYLAASAVTALCLWLTRRPEGRALSVLCAALWANGLWFDRFSPKSGWALCAALAFDVLMLGLLIRASKTVRRDDESEHSLLDAAPSIAAGLLAWTAAGTLILLAALAVDAHALPAFGAVYAISGSALGAVLHARRARTAEPETTLSAVLRLGALIAALSGIAVLTLSAQTPSSLTGLPGLAEAGALALLAALACRSALALAAGAMLLGVQYQCLDAVGLAALLAGSLCALAAGFASSGTVARRAQALARTALPLSWLLLLAAFGFDDARSLAQLPHLLPFVSACALAAAGLPLAVKRPAASALPTVAAALFTAVIFLSKGGIAFSAAPVLAAFLAEYSPFGRGRFKLLAALLAAGTFAAVYAESPASGTNLLLEAALDVLAAAAAWLICALWARRRMPKPSEAPRRTLRAAAVLLTAATALVLAGSILRDAEISASAPVYKAALKPADPRDVLLGDFIALDWDLLTPELKEKARQLSNRGEDAGPQRLALVVKDGVLQGAALLADGETAPADAVLVVGWRAAAMKPALPTKWFFPSGDANRFERAAFGVLRCTPSRCLIEGVLDASGSRIDPTPQSLDLQQAVEARFSRQAP